MIILDITMTFVRLVADFSRSSHSQNICIRYVVFWNYCNNCWRNMFFAVTNTKLDKDGSNRKLDSDDCHNFSFIYFPAAIFIWWQNLQWSARSTQKQRDKRTSKKCLFCLNLNWNVEYRFHNNFGIVCMPFGIRFPY